MSGARVPEGMSGARVAPDTGQMQVTDVDRGQWDPDGDEDGLGHPTGDQVRFHSLDESSSTNWSGFGGLYHMEEDGTGRRSHLGSAFHRPMSPGRLHVMANVTRRHRSSSGGRRYSGGSASGGRPKERSPSDGSVGHPGVAARLIRLSRDATQPNSGSVTDLRGGPVPDDEESDVLPALNAIPSVRPRSFTCPEIKVMQRKTKIKLMQRPPTPTPGDDLTCDGLVSHLEKSCSLSNSGDIFVHDEEEELPAIEET